MPPWRTSRGTLDLYVLAGLALWLLAIGYGLRDPWPADEPRFALIGKTIVESGQWLIPQRGPELYAEKPPVFLWMQAAAYGLTGSTRAGFLLPSLLAALATLTLVWDLARRLWDRRSAFWVAMGLLFSVQFTLQGRSAQIDAVLTLFTTLGLYGLLRHLLLGPDWRWYAAAGVATGLGVLSKGTGFLPWLILIPYALARWRRMDGLSPIGRDWRWLIGPGLLLLTIAVWAVPILYLATQPGNEQIAAYRDDLLLRQTLTRYADPWHHHKPFWYYFVQVAPLLWLPLSLLAPFAAPTWWRRLRAGAGDGRLLLLLGWILLVLLFFSLSPGKREVYILPALPALALAFGPLATNLIDRRDVQRALLALTALLALVITLASGWALYGDPAFASRIAEQHGVRPWGWFGAVGLAGLTGVIYFRRRAQYAFAMLMIALWSGYGLFGYPSMNDARSGKALMARVAATLPSGAALSLVSAPEQMLLQAPPGTRAFGFKTPAQTQLQAAFGWLRAAPDHWLLTPGTQLGTCIAAARSLDLGWSNRRHWYLLRANAIEPGCDRPGSGLASTRIEPEGERLD